MEIYIRDVQGAIDLVKEKPDSLRVISIYGTQGNHSKKISFPQAKEVLYLCFDDVSKKSDLPGCCLATKEHCIEALEFMSLSTTPLVVHCQVGVSRSTAIVLGHLLRIFPTYHQAVDKLLQIRKRADPNSLVLSLMCEILEVKDSPLEILQYLEQKQWSMFQ